MKNLAIGVVVGAAVIGGGYYYLSGEFDAQVRAALDATQSDETVNFDISYGSLETSLLSGSVTVTDIAATNRQTGQVIRVEKATGSMDLSRSGSVAFFSEASLSGISMEDDEIGIAVAETNLADFDVSSLSDQIAAEDFTSLPMTVVEVKGLKVTATDPSLSGGSVQEFRIELSEDKSTLEEFLLAGLEFNNPTNNSVMKMDTVHFVGFDLQAARDVISMAQASERDTPMTDEEIDELANRLAVASLDSYGLQSVKISGIDVTADTGLAIQLKNLELKDIERFGGIPLGMTFVMEGLEFLNFNTTSPQAEQIMTLAELDTLRLDYLVQTHFDPQTGRLSGDASFNADKLVHLAMDVEMLDVDLDKMLEQQLPLQVESIKMSLGQAREQAAFDMENPEAAQQMAEMQMRQATEMLNLMKQAYVGYYSELGMDLTLTDQGLVERGLKVNSALSGAPIDQLRQQFSLAAALNLSQLLGTSAPKTMPAVIDAYLSETSVPMTMSVRTKETLTMEMLDGVTPQNWHELFTIEFTGAEDKPAQAGN